MAVAFDAGAAGTTGAGAGTAASMTWSHTVGGSDRLLVVFVGSQTSGTPDPASITYGGVALSKYGTSIVSSGAANDEMIQVWTLVAPAVGTANIVVTYSPVAAASAVSISLTGVDQTTPLAAAVSSTGTTGTSGSSPAVSSAATGLVLSAVSAASNAAPTATGTSQTRDGSATSGATTPRYTAGSHQPGAASVTPSWSWGVSNGFVIAGLNVYAVGTAPGAAMKRPSVNFRSAAITRASVI